MLTSDGIQVGEGVVGYKIRGTTDWHSEDHKETDCVTKTKSARPTAQVASELVTLMIL